MFSSFFFFFFYCVRKSSNGDVPLPCLGERDTTQDYIYIYFFYSSLFFRSFSSRTILSVQRSKKKKKRKVLSLYALKWSFFSVLPLLTDSEDSELCMYVRILFFKIFERAKQDTMISIETPPCLAPQGPHGTAFAPAIGVYPFFLPLLQHLEHLFFGCGAVSTASPSFH